MKLRVSIFFSLFFFFIFLISTSIADDSISQSQQLSLLRNGNELSPSALVLPPSPKPDTALVAALDGTVYLVESASGRVIWSFSTGSSIYHSSANTPSSEHVECGDDWELIFHDTHFGKTRLKESVADYVAVTPIVSKDGAVILGSKRSTVFEVDAKTGKLLRSYGAADFHNASTTAVWSGDKDRQKVSTFVGANNTELADPGKLDLPEFLLQIVRTDYFLQSVGPGSGIVLWTMSVAEFEAVLFCKHNENPTFKASLDAEGEYASDVDSGLDFAMPYACPDSKLREVYRQRKSFLFEPANFERLSDVSSFQEHDILPMPVSHLMLPSQPKSEKFLPGHNGNMMLPGPVPNSLQPKISFYDSNDDNAVVLPQPHMEIAAPREIDLNRVIELSMTLLAVLSVVFLLIFYQNRSTNKAKVQISGTDLKSPPSKKKRARKSGKNNVIVEKQDNHLYSVEENIRIYKEAENEARLLYNKVNGRRIGKLHVSNKEIAKGSNGTIVLEGIYEGRSVAIKRLVQAHHDVAHKEIQNLIASDFHPNIVRWYGVEYDQDFVYLALERCACNLDDLITIYSDMSENPVLNKDRAFEFFKKTQIETQGDDTQSLWKTNGYPSPLLLKLMRDVVSGLVHLHELGIIHRDLKPQNVLINKERLLCAKLSDMGISKRLLEDMSSLGHSSTGCGSSGWQAPEQLLQGRQTRAVDLFSLGCVLFFCMTAGRHPFGERLERDVNIVNNKKDLFLVEFLPEAEDLVSCLLNHEPYLRPKAIEVLHHPLFWNSEMRLSFLRDVSDRVELEDRETNSVLLDELESTAPMALGTKWDEKMEPNFLANIGRYRRYKFDSVRDLLRVLRNKLNHFRELPLEIQELIGPIPEGFNEYFTSRFPRLLIEVYKVICNNCKDDECFQRYFRDID
ncbi:serine/threonine-protein kinase/endoribonuclease IRE1a-like [Vicia villosa]|uniref:serine/threonine-protein kinase/endoribonuclease IRE1a-like n=1 Tax=Vicia villosa TaxID=3911 RepID=UPI00273C6794|nr:serine/threonine-protein kinase/endoribonuclease IRE1a-like [Vicia villosa]